MGIIECYLGDREPALVGMWHKPLFRHAARIRAVMDFLVEQTETQSELFLGNEANMTKARRRRTE